MVIRVLTMVYDVSTISESKISVDVFIIYGESKGSLEKEIRKTIDVETVRVLDECQIQINEVSLNTRNKQFYINTENIGSVDCFVDLELVDVLIAGQKTTFGLENVAHLSSEQKKNLRIKAEEFEEEDAEDNQRIKVRAYYGERENSLVKILEGAFDVILKGIDYLFYGLIVGITIVTGIIVWKRYKKK